MIDARQRMIINEKLTNLQSDFKLDKTLKTFVSEAIKKSDSTKK